MNRGQKMIVVRMPHVRFELLVEILCKQPVDRLPLTALYQQLAAIVSARFTNKNELKRCLESVVDELGRRTGHDDHLQKLIREGGLESRLVGEKLVKYICFIADLRVMHTTDHELALIALNGVSAFHEITPPKLKKRYIYQPVLVR